MNTGSTQNTSRALDAPSLDFNPRNLVVNWPPAQLPRLDAEPSELQAIYIPSKGRALHVAQLLHALPVSDTPVYLLPTLLSDIPSALPARGEHVELLAVQDPECLAALRALRCVSNPVFAISAADWDLPLKRNYALWHAHKNGFHRILLLDDDIRGLAGPQLLAGASALSRWVVAGFFVDNFPDTSVVGHVELAVGEPLWPFLSGSCLFVRTDVPVGFFPPIYNEDWIFMAPAIEQGNICSLGLVSQAAHDPFSCLSLSTFQEPGEIIADGLFALLAAGRYMERFEPTVWSALLSQRRAWLRSLAAHAKDPRHRSAVDRARTRCDQITDVDCAGYINDLEYDRAQWARSLEELR